MKSGTWRVKLCGYILVLILVYPGLLHSRHEEKAKGDSIPNAYVLSVLTSPLMGSWVQSGGELFKDMELATSKVRMETSWVQIQYLFRSIMLGNTASSCLLYMWQARHQQKRGSEGLVCSDQLC